MAGGWSVEHRFSTGKQILEQERDMSSTLALVWGPITVPCLVDIYQ